MKNHTQKDNNERFLELGRDGIGRLLLRYAAPAIVAMTASSLYNIIDAIFVGQWIGEEALAGIGLVNPVMQLTAAFGAMVGVGAGSLLSIKLGAKSYGMARRILGNVVTLNIIMGLGLGAVLLLLLNPILALFGAGDDTLRHARPFMQVILLGNVVTHLYLGLNALLRSAGKPKQAMLATIYTVLINLILAPLFIKGFGWGVAGAAGATVLAQVLVLPWQIRLFSHREELLHFERGTFRPQRAIVKGSLAIGISPFLIHLCGCLVALFFNISFITYGGDREMAAYTLVFRIGFFFVMVILGMCQGMQPIAGYNYGARSFQRLRRVFWLTLGGATAVCIAAFVLGMFFPTLCAQAFTNEADLIARTTHDMPFYFITFPVIGVSIVATNFLQSIGIVKWSIFLSLSRQLLFILPLLYFLPKWWGSDGVWLSIPVSDLLAFVVAVLVLWREMRKFTRMEREAKKTAAEP